MPEANHFPNEWHRIGTRKETHGVPENPSILLLYIPIPVSGAGFYKIGSIKIARIAPAVMVESIQNVSDYWNRRRVANQR
jgi:hypothetical protein